MYMNRKWEISLSLKLTITIVTQLWSIFFHVISVYVGL
jgi:hypothetical protein